MLPAPAAQSHATAAAPPRLPPGRLPEITFRSSSANMAAMIFTRPPQSSHFSMSMANTLFRRRAQCIRTAEAAPPCAAAMVGRKPNHRHGECGTYVPERHRKLDFAIVAMLRDDGCKPLEKRLGGQACEVVV